MIRLALVLAICGVAMAEETATTMYHARLVSDPAKEVLIQKAGEALSIEILGFATPLHFPVTSSSAGICVVWLKHQSAGSKIAVHLPILDPGATCRPLPPGITATIVDPPVHWKDETLTRIAGKDRTLRKLVESASARKRK